MTKQPEKKSYWFKEWLTPDEVHIHHIKKDIVRQKTKFQKAVIADSHDFGRCLILDGEMQSALRDEFIYHECLVHPAMVMHPNPRNILVMGGGEGATLRELLKYPSVQKIVMVDIDGEVVKFCQTHLKPWHQGAFKNRKVELVVADAKTFVETTDKKFDLIISDLPSPMEGGPAHQLYTVEFYRTLVRRLEKNGLFVMQGGPGHLLQFELHQVLYRTLTKVFAVVRSYQTFVPSFDGPWAFLMGTQGPDPLKLSAVEVNKRLKDNIRGSLKFYDGVTHVGLFHIPKNLRDLCQKEKRVVKNNKIFYFYT